MGTMFAGLIALIPLTMGMGGLSLIAERNNCLKIMKFCDVHKDGESVMRCNAVSIEIGPGD